MIIACFIIYHPEKGRNGSGGKEITAYSLLEEIKNDKPYRYSTEINKLMEYFKK